MKKVAKRPKSLHIASMASQMTGLQKTLTNLLSELQKTKHIVKHGPETSSDLTTMTPKAPSYQVI